jgi:hypothetical protein
VRNEPRAHTADLLPVDVCHGTSRLRSFGRAALNGTYKMRPEKGQAPVITRRIGCCEICQLMHVPSIRIVGLTAFALNKML